MFRALRSFLASLEDRLYQLFVAESPRAYRIGGVVVLVVVASASLLLVFNGAAPQKNNCGDSLFMLDYAWRFENGQRPHVDFYDFLGPTSLLPLLLGMAVGGPNCNAFAYGAAIVSPVLAIVAWWVTRRRFPAFAMACIVLMIAGLSVGVYPLGCGGSWRDTAYSVNYNRFQWSALCILALTSCLAPRGPICRRTSAMEGFLIGLLAGLLILGKLNYTLAGILVVAAGAVLCRRTISSWVATIVGVVCCVAPYQIYLHFDLAAWHRDITMLGGVQEPGRRIRVIVNIIENENTMIELALVGLIAALHLHRLLAPGQAKGIAGRFLNALFVVLVFAGIGILTTSGNMQFYSIPLVALAAMALAEATRSIAMPVASSGQSASDDRSESYRLRVALSYFFAAVLVVSIFTSDYLSLGCAIAWKRWRGPEMPSDARIAAPPLRDMFLQPPTNDRVEIDRLKESLPTTEDLRHNTYQYGRRLNDGLALLKDRYDKNSRILALEASNPFPFALQLPPPHGAPCLWHLGRLENDKHHPPAEVVFKEVTHLMVPKVGEGVELAFLHRIFDPYVNQHFQVVAESPMWTLMERKKN